MTAVSPTVDATTQDPDDASASSSSPDAPLSAARAELMTLTEPKELAAWLTRERQALQDRWSSERGGRAWMHEHSSLLDAVVRRLFALSQERAAAEPNGNGHHGDGHKNGSGGVAILAVGGYGQRLLAPHSDLDITFLSERDDDPPVLRQMFRLVMDVLLSGAKMKVGYAYRTLADLVGDTLDHQTRTALLDARLITGDGGLFWRFQESFPATIAVADFLFRKEAERNRVRARNGDSPFVVEPNVKEGVGGVRDLQTAAWMARVRFGKSGEALWRDLVRRRVLTREDWEALSAARELLLTVRCGLHVLSGERRDILTAGRQEQIALTLGHPAVEEDGTPGVERFMRRYYEAAWVVQRLSDKVMARCLDAPLPIGHDTGLSSVRRAVSITDPVRVDADPLWPLTALEACQEYTLEMATPTDEAVERYLTEGRLGEPGSDTHRAAGARFVALLARPGDATATVRRMQRTGLLRALLPELDDCFALIPYDPSHTRTVGEHSLLVLDNLIHLRERTDDSDPELGGYHTVLSTLLSPLPLLLSALLHDIGKQWPRLRASGDRAGHELTGAERIPEICARLGCSEAIAEQTEFLVRHHLLLARVSRLRDLALPSTIREVMRAVGDQERLRMLYLHTWADTSAVGPGVWTGMTARLLDELFARTDEALGMGEETPEEATGPEQEARLDNVRQRLQRQLVTADRYPGGTSPATPPPPEVAEAHVSLMPTAYLLNTPPDTVALHLAMVGRLRESGGVVVDMRPAPGAGPNAAETELTVVTHDAPGLFAKITGALFACDVQLHSAQAFTRPDGDEGGPDIVIDTLAVDYRERPLGPEKKRAVDEALRLVLTGAETVEALVARKRRGAALSEPPRARSVQVDDHTAPGFTLVDVETQDETGVAYRLASSFARQGWNIHAARVSTWGGNARCAFYLTDGAGHALDAATVRDRLAESLALPTGRR
jgi:[protein-PII] uridylyltransferase